MVRKIIQWVPIDGTRWRNEFVYGHKIRGAGVHSGVAAPAPAEQCATVDAEEAQMPDINQDGHHPNQGRDILAGRAAIRK